MKKTITSIAALVLIATGLLWSMLSDYKPVGPGYGIILAGLAALWFGFSYPYGKLQAAEAEQPASDPFEGVAPGSLVLICEPTAISFGSVGSVENDAVTVTIWSDRPGEKYGISLRSGDELVKRAKFYNTDVEKAEILSDAIVAGEKELASMKRALVAQESDVAEFRELMKSLNEKNKA